MSGGVPLVGTDGEGIVLLLRRLPHGEDAVEGNVDDGGDSKPREE